VRKVTTLRNICVCALFLALLTAESASARRCRRVACCTRSACGQPSHGGERGFPQYCLQRMWLDNEGDCDDVYECLTYLNECGEIPQERLWYGCLGETEELPEECEINCESGRGMGTTNVPPHRKTVGTAADAWNSLNYGLSRAGISVTPSASRIYMIPADKSGLFDSAGNKRPVYMMIVKVPTSMPGKTPKVIGDRYFAIETEALAYNHEADFRSPAHVGPGKQLTIDFVVGTEPRRALVWLKQ
jgi:hypothetical protein